MHKVRSIFSGSTKTRRSGIVTDNRNHHVRRLSRDDNFYSNVITFPPINKACFPAAPIRSVASEEKSAESIKLLLVFNPLPNLLY